MPGCPLIGAMASEQVARHKSLESTQQQLRKALGTVDRVRHRGCFAAVRVNRDPRPQLPSFLTKLGGNAKKHASAAFISRLADTLTQPSAMQVRYNIGPNAY